jgi:hypothetical protein
MKFVSPHETPQEIPRYGAPGNCRWDRENCKTLRSFHSIPDLPQASQPLLMTKRAGSVCSPLKPKNGLNGPPKALVAGAESFHS